MLVSNTIKFSWLQNCRPVDFIKKTKVSNGVHSLQGGTFFVKYYFFIFYHRVFYHCVLEIKKKNHRRCRRALGLGWPLFRTRRKYRSLHRWKLQCSSAAAAAALARINNTIYVWRAISRTIACTRYIFSACTCTCICIHT